MKYVNDLLNFKLHNTDCTVFTLHIIKNQFQTEWSDEFTYTDMKYTNVLLNFKLNNTVYMFRIMIAMKQNVILSIQIEKDCY